MNNSSPTIVVFANPVFQDPGLSSTVELAKQWSKQTRVVFVNFPLTLLDLLKSKNRKRILPALIRKRSVVHFPTFANSNIEVVEAPVGLPLHFLSHGFLYKVLLRWMNDLYLRRLSYVLKKDPLETVVAINALNPFYSRAFLAFPAQDHIYYCYDNIHAAHWLSKHGGPLEDQMVESLKRIAVTSAGLREKFDSRVHEIHWIPNGLNPNHFTRTSKFNLEELRFVYSGAVDERLDYALIFDLLEAFPESKLKLVGPLLCEESKKLAAHPQVQSIGAVPKENVGAELEASNVGLIPFLTTEFTSFIYPLKVNEYLHLGMPVLTTNFADLSPFSDLLNPIQSLEEAKVEVQRIMKNEWTAEQIQMRISFAALQSWENRSKSFSALWIEK
jgi:glycosyltransferase involved in cell wall biosynthesis